MKLILFDIDGTLIYHLPHWDWDAPYIYGMKKVFGYTGPYISEKYNGKAERFVPWDLIRHTGITRKDYLKIFPQYVDAMYEYIQKNENNYPKSFEQIQSAVTFVEKLYRQHRVILGILTGNAKKIALWKLRHTKLAHYFSFGLYGDEADDRISLARQVFDRAKKELNITLIPKDVVVIGDMIHDIRCGKAIGARTIAVTTGVYTRDRSILAREKPDYLVDSLTDPRILSLFSLE